MGGDSTKRFYAAARPRGTGIAPSLALLRRQMGSSCPPAAPATPGGASLSGWGVPVMMVTRPPSLEDSAGDSAGSWNRSRRWRKGSRSIQGAGRVGAPGSRLVWGGEGGAGRQEGVGWVRRTPGLWKAATGGSTAVLGGPWWGRSSTGGTPPAW